MNYIIKTNLKGGWQTIKFNDYEQYIQKWQQLKENGDIYENEKPIVRFNQKGGNGNIYFLIKINKSIISSFERKEKKIVGLGNLNNYCFVNSIVQIVNSIDYLRNKLLEIDKNTLINENTFFEKHKIDITKGISYDDVKEKDQNFIDELKEVRILKLIQLLEIINTSNNFDIIRMKKNQIILKNILASGTALGWTNQKSIKQSDSIDIIQTLLPLIIYEDNDKIIRTEVRYVQTQDGKNVLYDKKTEPGNFFIEVWGNFDFNTFITNDEVPIRINNENINEYQNFFNKNKIRNTKLCNQPYEICIFEDIPKNFQNNEKYIELKREISFNFKPSNNFILFFKSAPNQNTLELVVPFKLTFTKDNLTFRLKSLNYGASTDGGHYQSIVYHNKQYYNISDSIIKKVRPNFLKNIKNWRILAYEKIEN
jgi:hypothetical protein